MQILTQRGWLTYDEVQPGDLTVGFNPETGRSEWTAIHQVHVYDDAPLVRLTNKTWEATCTPSHRWAAVHWKHVGRKGRQGRTKNEFTTENVMVETREITSRHSLRLAAPADVGSGPAISEREAELLGWILGDGWVISPKSRTPGSMHWRTLRGTRPSLALGQAKPEGVKAIDDLVTGSSFNRTVEDRKKPDGTPGLPSVRWTFHRPYSEELLKRSGYDHADPVPFVLSLSESQREAFLRGVFGAEGSQNPRSQIKGAGDYPGSKRYPQADGPKQDAIVLAIYLSGMRPGVTEWNPQRGENLGCKNPKPGAVFCETKPFIGGQSIKQEDAGHGPVWCVTTSLGTWTMRQDYQVMLTGNSHGWYDQGGMLQPGMTLAMNATGQPEAVLPPGLTQALSGANSPMRQLSITLSNPEGPVAKLQYAIANPGGPMANLSRTLANPGGPMVKLAKTIADPGGPMAGLGKAIIQPAIGNLGKALTSSTDPQSSLATALDDADKPMADLATALADFVAAHPGQSGGDGGGTGGGSGGHHGHRKTQPGGPNRTHIPFDSSPWADPWGWGGHKGSVQPGGPNQGAPVIQIHLHGYKGRLPTSEEKQAIGMALHQAIGPVF